MRVLHVDTQRGWRGGERQVLWLAKALQDLGVTSAIAARRGEPLAAAAREAGLETVELAPLFPVDPAAVLALRSAIQHGRFEVVHAHSANGHTLSALALAGLDTRLVVTRHVAFAPLRSPWSRWKYRRPDATVAISRAVRDVLVDHGLPAERVTLITEGTDTGRPANPVDAARLTSLGIRPGLPLVVMVAALQPEKSPGTFLEALASARAGGAEIQALLVGDGPLMAEVRAARLRLGLETVVQLAGWRTEADRFIAAADIVVLTSRAEGFGSVLLDALLFGKPVVASRAGGIPEAVFDGETGFLAPVGDVNALGAALARLVTDRALREQMGAAAKRRAAEFSMERVAAQTAELYQRLLEGPR